MFKQAAKSIPTVWKCAKGAVFCKLLQALLTAVLTPMSIYFTQILIDRIGLYLNGSMSLMGVIGVLLLLMLSFFFLAGTGFFDNRIDIALQRGVNRNLTDVIAGKFLSLEYACFEDRDIADTLNRMGTEPQQHILRFFQDTVACLTHMVTIAGTAVIFSQVSIWFSVFFLLMLVPLLYLDFKTMDMMNTMFNNQSERERRLEDLGGLLNTKHSLLELKIFGAVQYILGKWKRLNKEVLDERVRTTIRSQKYYAISTVLIILWAGAVVAVLIARIRQGAISIGVFISLIGSAGTILSQSETLSSTFSRLSQEHLIMKHFERFLALPQMRTEEKREESRKEKPKTAEAPGRIVLEDVHFRYPHTESEVLKGLSMEIDLGRHNAIVGENGAGKSTLIKLLLKLYRPDSGRILIDGRDLNDLTMEELRPVYSVVFQDYMSYSLTLRENIAFGDIRKIEDDGAIGEALTRGLAAELLDSLPGKLQQNLGKLEEDGVDLSGGQWQRVAIARACLADSRAVILDEPTASLDPIAEAEMYRNFTQLLRQKGCILISHRLASARMADTIYVLKDGVLAEQGPHDALMEKEGLYASMYSAQSHWYRKEETEA